MMGPEQLLDKEGADCLTIGRWKAFDFVMKPSTDNLQVKDRIPFNFTGKIPDQFAFCR